MEELPPTSSLMPLILNAQACNDFLADTSGAPETFEQEIKQVICNEDAP